MLRRLAILLSLTIAASFALPTIAVVAGGAEAYEAAAGTKKRAEKSKKVEKRKKRRRKRVRKEKVCERRNGKRRCRWVPRFEGTTVIPSGLREEPLSRPSGDVRIYSANHREEIAVNIYREDGELDDEALAKLDRIFRCKRSGRVRAVDPRLYEILSRLNDRFGGKRVELISGFRYQRKESSRHFHGSAMDIRIPGVSVRALYEFTSSLDTGGMGVGKYPTSGFIHVDMRAPGVKSYRWLDYSGPKKKKKKKKKKRKKRKKREKKPVA